MSWFPFAWLSPCEVELPLNIEEKKDLAFNEHEQIPPPHLEPQIEKEKKGQIKTRGGKFFRLTIICWHQAGAPCQEGIAGRVAAHPLCPEPQATKDFQQVTTHHQTRGVHRVCGLRFSLNVVL